MQYPGWDSSWLAADVKHRDVHTCVSHLAPLRDHVDLFKTFRIRARWSVSKSVCFSPPPQCQVSPVVTRSDIDIYIQLILSWRWSGCMVVPLLRLAGPEELALTLHNVLLLRRGRGAILSAFALLPATCARRVVAHLRLSPVTSGWGQTDVVTNLLYKAPPEGLLPGEDSVTVFEVRVASERCIPLSLILFSPTWHIAASRMRSGPLGYTHACMCWMHTYRCVSVCGLLRIKNASFCFRQCFQCLPFQLGGLCF